MLRVDCQDWSSLLCCFIFSHDSASCCLSDLLDFVYPHETASFAEELVPTNLILCSLHKTGCSKLMTSSCCRRHSWLTAKRRQLLLCKYRTLSHKPCSDIAWTTAAECDPTSKTTTKTTNAIQDVDKMRCQFQHVWCNLWISNRLTVLLGEKAQFGEDWSREERYAREVLICSLLREARTCCCFSHGVIKLRKMTHATFSSANRSLITIDWWPCSCLDRDFSCLDRSVIVFVLLLLLLFRTSIR